MPDQTPDPLQAAHIDLVYRARRARVACPPEGRADRAGRWYPSDRESAGGLDVRAPTASWPWSYLKGCCTKKHVQDVAEASPEYFDELVRQALPHARALYHGDPRGQKQLQALVGHHPKLAAQVLAGALRAA